MQAWQATVQDVFGNAVPNPIVYVYEEDGMTLAVIYNEAGEVIANPINGTLEGFVQFWADRGTYKVVGANGGVSETWQVDLADEEALEVANSAKMAAGMTPMDFGAVGDGVADDTTALEVAILHCIANGASLNGAGRTFRVTSTVMVPAGRPKWRDLTIDGTGIPPIGDFTTTVIEKICTAPVQVGQLSSDVSSGASTLTLADTSNVGVGDWVLLRSQKRMAETEVEGQETRHSRACEMLRVRSVNGSIVGFWTQLQDGYRVADSATLWKIQTSDGVDFENVTIIGSDVGIRVRDGFESRYRGCQFYNQSAFGVDEQRCYRSNGDDWYFESQSTEPGFTSAPYGLAYTGCHDCSYGDIRGLRIRHLTTTGSAGTNLGRTVSRGCSLGDIICFEAFSSVVDQHPGGGFIQVGNVRATFAPNASTQSACQFQGAGGSVQSIVAQSGGAILFDTYGFNQDGFTPHVQVGSISCPDALTFAVSVSNYSSRYGTGTPQNISIYISNINTLCGVGVICNPNSADIFVSIFGGQITALSSRGMGRTIYATTTSGNIARFELSGVKLASNGPSRIIQVEAGSLNMSGGSLTGIGTNAVLYLQAAATARLIGTVEDGISVTQAGGSSLLRASMA